jgi:ABC-type multidrug transport system fused ATPase/permease subunit
MIITGIGLLVYTIGVSAFVGLGILLAVAPFQGWLFGQLIKYRAGQEKIVDKRVRLITEVINNIRVVKLYAYESIFGEKVAELRSQELEKLKGFGLMHALINSTFYFLPILAAVCESLSSIEMVTECSVTFVTYGLTGHELNPAIIFSALQFFNVLRLPIAKLPMVVSAVMDAIVALGRIGDMLKVSCRRKAHVTGSQSPPS